MGGRDSEADSVDGGESEVDGGKLEVDGGGEVRLYHDTNGIGDIGEVVGWEPLVIRVWPPSELYEVV
jgi:hypothetical protein